MKVIHWVAVGLMLIGSTACSDINESNLGLRTYVSTETPLTVDTSFYRISPTASDELAKFIPRFSGAFKEGSKFVILLAYPYTADQEAYAINKVREFFESSDRGHEVLEVRPGKHEFIQFRKWEYQLGILNLKYKVNSFGFREDQQILTVDVKDEATRTAYLSDLENTLVPASLVVVTVNKSAYSLTNVQNHQRPAFGGIQIRTKYGPSSGSYHTCTAGFRVAIDPISVAPKQYLLTNSHCVQGHEVPMGGYTGQDVYQPVISVFPNYRVGTVEMNPASGSIPGYIECTPGNYCRYSDAAAIRLSISNWDASKIARTQSPGIGPGTIGSTSLANPYYYSYSNTGHWKFVFNL